MDTAPDDDDARSVELGTLTAIWPEIRRPLDADGSGLSTFTFELELPVNPARPVTVLFPAPQHDGQQASAAPEPVDSLLVSHLPPLSLRVTLPDSYPETRPPQATISTTPPWLPRETLASLEDEGARLWQDAGRDLVAYAYIDHVQRAAEDVFGAVSSEGTLEVNPTHKLAVLDYDIKAKRAAFEKESFECGVCLDPKKGSSCHKMVDCGHIFCLGCLRDFYGDAIEQGEISSVRCLTPNCAKARAAAAASNGGPSCQGRKPKTFISPSELLQIGLSGDVVKRYVTLKYKTELESDKDTIYCPRQWCNGAARSKKHKKPEGLEFAETSDGESEPGANGDEEDGAAADGGAAQAGKKNEQAKAGKFSPADLLCVCEDCGFAFCARCLQTWHGEFVRCAPRRNKDELTEEEKASLEYLQLHTSPCPTCSAPAQKTHGCNHMICSRCDTHFCYLCSSWLDPANPYEHYNQQADGKVTSCYMRLWELEGGDGDDVGLGFHGGVGPLAHGGAVDALFDLDVPDEESDDSESESDDDEDAHDQQQQQRPPVGRAGEPVAVAREAPLVLRLVDNQRPRGGRRRGGRAEHAPEPAHHHQGGRGAGREAGRGRAAGPQGAAGAGARGRGQNPRPQRGAPPRAMDARGRGPGRGARAAAARGVRGVQAGDDDGLDERQRGLLAVAAGDERGFAAIGLEPVYEEWVRRFVRMALLDLEPGVDEGDSESDDGGRA